MEVSGTVLQRVTYVSGGAGTDSQSFPRRLVSGGSVAVGSGARFHGVVRGVRVSARRRMDSGFCDNGHLQFYQASLPRCGGRDKQKGSPVLTTKRKLKLLKGISQGLPMFSELSLSLDSEKRTLLDEVQGKLNLDAAEILLKQLEQLRAEEKERKRKRKQEKAKLKGSRMKNVPDCESSSSSSSESSDSDCGEIVDMKSVRSSAAPATVDRLLSPVQKVTMLSPPSSSSQGRTTIENNFCEVGTAHRHAVDISRNDTSLNNSNVSFENESSIATTAPQKRIEVCMGNKCKRSGAPALLQEFERVMGAESAAVVGCKCMGKCKTGPNVRIQNSVGDGLAEGINDSVKVPANPLCIGVALEDVDAIVASFFGENQRDIGLGAAAATI